MADRLSLIEPVVGEEELAYIEEVLESGYMTQGPFADRFEEQVADLVDAAHAVPATSCTTGMELALDAVGIGPGDEVILPSFTYPATANVVERLGADPVLVDSDRDSYNVDPDAMQNAIGDDTAALLPVCLFGQPLDAKPIRELAADHDIAVVEDAAWGLGASYDGEMVGSQFDASSFSFHPRKSVTTGEGGMVTTDDDALESEMRSIKNFGLAHDDRSGFVRGDATNYRLSDVLAAIGVAQMEKFDRIMDRREKLATRYDDLLAGVDGVRPPCVPDVAEHTYGSYCAYVEAGDETTRDAVMELMDGADIETQVGTYALHRTPAFEDARSVGDLDGADDLYHDLLTLPMEDSMTAADQRRVVEELEAAVAAET
jgi:dTDP-4-amino-4,6-dideoxygalactose transaminase